MMEVVAAGAGDLVYTMTFQEFAIMAAASGIKKLYGFDAGFVVPDQADLVNGLHRMVQKEMIREENGHFVLTDTYAELFGDIKEAKDVLIVKQKNVPERTKCIYLGRKVWVTEVNELLRPGMRCRKWSRERLVDILEEENYLPITFPEEGSLEGADITPLEEQEGNYLKDAEEIMNDETCQLLIERYGFNGESITLELQIVIRRNVDGYVLERMSGSRKVTMEYKLDALRAEMRTI